MIPLATINAYASQFAGTPVTISCEADATFPRGLAGYTVFVGGQVVPLVHLPSSTCARLEHIDTASTIVPADVLALAHEATHVALDSMDECLVETTALANDWQLVRLFKLAAWRARAILAGAVRVDAELPAVYRSCRPSAVPT